jgi:septal ring factor EnvC (AmiA/AmiB activator)
MMTRCSIVAQQLCALIALSVGVPSTHAAEETDANQALDQVVQKLNALEEWFTDAQRRSAAIELQIQLQDQTIAGLRQQSRKLEASLSQTQIAVTQLRKQRHTLTEQTQAQRSIIVAHVQAASRLKSDDFVKQLLSKRSSADTQRYMRYHGYFSQQRLESIEQYKASIAKLTETQAALNEQLTTQEIQSQALTKQTTAVQAKRDERASAINALAGERESKTKQRDALLADSERLRALLAQLRSQLSALDGEAFAAAKGSLPRPLRGQIRHSFGKPRAGTNLSWRGIDLAAGFGDTVSAVFRGKVVFSDWLRGFGLIAIVDHGGGYMTLYGHADALLKNAGDWVESGEPIAEAGNSGGGYEPGIYFELRQDGAVQNPTAWLAK